MPIDRMGDVEMIRGKSVGGGIDGLCLLLDSLMSAFGWLTNVQEWT